jgi:rRNA maturation RNase YbeY
MSSVLIRNHQRSFTIAHCALVLRTRALLQAAGKQGQHVSLVFTDPKTMRHFNKQYRGVDKCTDVLSVPHEYFMHSHDSDGAGGDGPSSSAKNANEQVELGDIIICPQYVQRYCSLRNQSQPSALWRFGVKSHTSPITDQPHAAIEGAIRGVYRAAPSALQLRLDRFSPRAVCRGDVLCSDVLL